MHILFTYLALYKSHKWVLLFGIVLAIFTLLAGIVLLTLSSWFLVVCAVIGLPGIYSFNFMLPAVGIRISAIVRIIGRYFERLISHDATFRVLEYLRVFFFSKLLPLSPAGLTRFHQGDLLNRVVADIDTLDHLYLRVVSPLISICITIIVVTYGISFLDIRMAITLGSISLLIIFFFPLFFYRFGKITGENLVRLRGEYRKKLTVWLQCQAELVIFGASDFYREKMENTELSWYKTQHYKCTLMAISQSLIQLIGSLVIVSILWIFTIKETVDSIQSNALIAFFVFCALSVFETLLPISGIFQYLGQVTASASRITQIINQKPKVYFDGNVTSTSSCISVQLNRVFFSYNDQYRNVLEDISLNIPAGSRVAILGRTGCGKSTLLNLLTRAWDPQIGSILIGNIPIVNLSEVALRKIIGMVTQRVYLFSATLRDNLLLAAPEVSDRKLYDILERVNLYKLLENGGLNSWFGEGGRQLSFGELRLLSIARALLYDSPLMLLDEPTEGLDSETETQILNLLNKEMNGKTVLMVTHRLRGLENFDQVVIMETGRIINQGKPDYVEALIK